MAGKQPALFAIAAAFSLVQPAFALTPEVREVIVNSIRPGQLAAVESATGGLDKLALLTVDIDIDLATRHAGGVARLDWRNSTTGQPVTDLPIRLSANSDSANGPKAEWDDIHITMPGGDREGASFKQKSVTIMMVKLPRPLAPDERVIIDGKIDATMSAIAAGSTNPVTASMHALSNMGAAKPDGQEYGTFACGDGICTLTGFTPEVPTFMNGAFDIQEASGIGDATFSEPLNLLMGVVADTGVTLAATGLEIGRIPMDNHRTRTSFAMAATREVGIVASDKFGEGKAEEDGVHIRSFALKADAASDKIVLKAARESLGSFEKAFGKYPWSFLNVAEGALVGGAGGVELPGLAVVGAGFYHRDDKGGMDLSGDPTGAMAMLGGLGGVGSGLFDEMLDFITRHEVAHQWWHAEVGSHSQLHPYVDEPLAQWSALYSTRQSKGPKAAEHTKTMQIAMNFQALALMNQHDGKVARPAGEFDSQIQYAGLVYGKAPLFFEAASQKFGEAKVLAGLRLLTDAKKFRRATPDDVLLALCHSVGPAAAPQMRALWKRWFEEIHGVDDIGPLDLNSVLGGMGLPIGIGGNGKLNIDPAMVQQMLQQLRSAMDAPNDSDPALPP